MDAAQETVIQATLQLLLADIVCSTEPSAWRYVAEGAANLVVAYKPDGDHTGRKTDLEHKALRLKKRNITHDLNHGHFSEMATGWIGIMAQHQEDGEAAKPATIDNDVFEEFHNRILTRLFEPEHLLEFESVKLQPAWLRALGSVIHPSRPSVQSARSEIDDNCSSGLLMEDLTSQLQKHGKDFDMAFEIKPKWAFLPQSIDNLKPEHRQIKSSYCRTCIYRAVRSVPTGLTKGGVEYSNGCLNPYYTSKMRFCPLMLFESSDLQTVRDGVGRLHREWLGARSGSSGVTSTPLDPRPSQVHSNFRVFVNGAAVGPENLELEEQTLDLLASSIYHSSEFKQLDLLQRRLDPIDLDGISILLENVPGNAVIFKPIELAELEALIPLLVGLKTISQYEVEFQKLSIREKVVMYMLSMTMKDCSAFVRLPVATQKTMKSGLGGSLSGDVATSQIVDIKLIDLDLKPLSRLTKYIKRDTEILSHFQQLLDSSAQPVPCLDLRIQ